MSHSNENVMFVFLFNVPFTKIKPLQNNAETQSLKLRDMLVGTLHYEEQKLFPLKAVVTLSRK